MLAEKRTHVQPMLAEYCKTRDPSLRNALAEHYLYMAEMVARRFSGRGVEYDDLFQVASLALLRALERFDIDKGLQFVTFVMPTMVGEVRNYFRDKSRMIRTPRRGVELYAQLRKTREALSGELKREPTLMEIAQRMQLREDDILDAIEMHHAAQTLSIDAPSPGGEENLTLETFLGQEDPSFEQVENRDFWLRSLDALDDNDRKLITLRMVDQRSQREVAELLGVSQMQISRLERKIYAKLRQQLTER